MASKNRIIANPLSEVQKSLLEQEATREKFWSRVLKTETCWLWRGSLDWKGYGRFVVNRFKKKYSSPAHRISYYLVNGFEVPATMSVDHLCMVKGCVNPKHLDVVTNKENVLRGNSPMAVNARKTHCKNGHEFELFLPKYAAQMYRRCRICWLESMRAWHRRKREERNESINTQL